MTKRLIRYTHTRVILFALSLGVSAVPAQTKSDQTANSHRVGPASELWLGSVLAPARIPRRAALTPIPASSLRIPAPRFFALAAAPTANLGVVGSGTVGRLTKWSGFTSSNSFIGNSTIFEDKNGLVGIGTDTPTSRLTVSGLIESTIGGFKFPDGTIQTTSASGSLFEVAHDSTLRGNGTLGSPLGVNVPLLLTGSFDGGVIRLTNIGALGDGLVAGGGPGGTGVIAQGGANFDTAIGDGAGGVGMSASGGTSNTRGGDGVRATGGFGAGTAGGIGLFATGGSGVDDIDSAGTGGPGLRAVGGTGTGPLARAGDGIYATKGMAISGAAPGRAGLFEGDVEIIGALSVTGPKNFKIDHPLDPKNKYLLHASVESSEVLNIYSGNVVTNAKGEARVTLPDWFEALNRDFRYQLTVIGAFAQAIIEREIEDNRFTIRTSAPNVKVSWQVTGVRSDRVMLKHPFNAEEAKSERLRGAFLNPEFFDSLKTAGSISQEILRLK